MDRQKVSKRHDRDHRDKKHADRTMHLVRRLTELRGSRMRKWALRIPAGSGERNADADLKVSEFPALQQAVRCAGLTRSAQAPASALPSSDPAHQEIRYVTPFVSSWLAFNLQARVVAASWTLALGDAEQQPRVDFASQEICDRLCRQLACILSAGPGDGNSWPWGAEQRPRADFASQFNVAGP